MSEAQNFLHIYSQALWHDTAFIVATPESLTLLRDAIDRALTKGRAVHDDSYTSDGEGYDLVILNVGGDDKFWENPKLPYSEGEAMGLSGSGQQGPYNLLHRLHKYTERAVDDMRKEKPEKLSDTSGSAPAT